MFRIAFCLLFLTSAVVGAQSQPRPYYDPAKPEVIYYFYNPPTFGNLRPYHGPTTPKDTRSTPPTDPFTETPAKPKLSPVPEVEKHQLLPPLQPKTPNRNFGSVAPLPRVSIPESPEPRPASKPTGPKILPTPRK